MTDIKTIRDYEKDISTFNQALSTIIRETKDKFSSVYRVALKKPESLINYPRINLMDHLYKSWTSKRKKAGKVKVRHLCKVDDYRLTNLHYSIVRDFPLDSSHKVYSYKKDMTCAKCAAEHVGAFALYKLDISDFFYSITRRIIRDMYFEAFNSVIDNAPKYLNDSILLAPTRQVIKEETLRRKAEIASNAIALLVTRSDPRGHNNKDCVLPIGTIPASSISNNALLSIDRKLSRMSRKEGVIYTRYSDNMFFSHKTDHISREFQEKVKEAVEGFEIHGEKPYKINKSKTTYSARWRQQRILGIVINSKLNISRGKEKYMRSALNHLYHDFQGLYDLVEAKSSSLKDLRAQYNQLHRRSDRIFGQLAHVYQVSPQKYLKYATWQHSTKLLRDEINLMIAEWATSGKNLKGAKGGAQ